MGAPDSSSGNVFAGSIKSGNTRYDSLFFTGYGAAGLVHIYHQYGYDDHLRYRKATGWSDVETWRDAHTLANLTDITVGNLSGSLWETISS